jgi:UV DNA damage endonuclease
MGSICPKEMINLRWGYCCIALGLPNCTTAHTISVKNLLKIPQRQDRISRITSLARENLANTIRLLRYNKAHDIMMYRFSSQLVPLATHEETAGWDYLKDLAPELNDVGDTVKSLGIRVSTHPGQHTVINSRSDSAWELARRDLEYHNGVLKQMGLDSNAVMVVHVGGAYGNCHEAAERFVERFWELSSEIRSRLVIENDDRSFSIGDVLKICHRIERPMVLDVHHHHVFSKGEDLRDLIPEIFSTWEDITPKVHFSSPKGEKEIRSHADDLRPNDFIEFYDLCQGREFDAMIEAKRKDLALLKLRQDISGILT